jgi:hypothetical protein
LGVLLSFTGFIQIGSFEFSHARVRDRLLLAQDLHDHKPLFSLVHNCRIVIVSHALNLIPCFFSAHYAQMCLPFHDEIFAGSLMFDIISKAAKKAAIALH